MTDACPALELRIANHMQNIGFVGISIRALSLEAGLSAEAAMQMELAVVEAITNIVRHGKLTNTSEIRIHVANQSDRVIYTIYDRGSPIPDQVWIDSSRQHVFCFDQHHIQSVPESGMGLAMIHAVSDDVSYTPEPATNNTLKMVRLKTNSQVDIYNI